MILHSSVVALIALLPFMTFASAQTPSVQAPTLDRMQPFSTLTTHVSQISPDVVVARVMSFDRDNDGRVVKDELPDRMHNLLSGAADETLDRAAIRARATTAAATTVTGRVFQGSGGGYTFGDQISLSTRPHVDGALDDLRLPALTREQAQAIVTPFMEKLEADATEALVADLHFVLTVSQLTSLRTQIDRQLSSQPTKNLGPGGPTQVVRSADGKAFQIFMGGSDLRQRINGFALPPEQTKQALAAFERFKERIRPGDAERSQLLAQLKDVLSDEERENYGAALARRPLVKSGFPGMTAAAFPGVITGSGAVTIERRIPDGAINNALFIMPKTAARAPQALDR
jgi:hypothetical protein